MDEHPKRHWADKGLHHALVLFAVAVFLLPAIHNQFVSIDDPQYLTENAVVREGLTWHGIAWSFGNFHAANWHPLTWLSHMLDVTIFGLHPAGHHAVNLALHAATAILMQRFLWAFTGMRWCGTIAALLFALHPLRVESFAWVAERKDVLAGFFWMTTLLAYRGYLSRRGPRNYVTMILVFALGLGAKSMLMTLPVVLLMLDWWPLGRLGAPLGEDDGGPGNYSRLTSVLYEKTPFLLLSSASLLITYAGQAGARTISDYGLGERVANACVSLVAYLGATLWPVKLAVYYPFRTGIPLHVALLAGVLLLGCSWAAFLGRRARPWLWTGWLWYLVVLAPVSGILQVGHQARADRYTYLPTIGLVVAVVWAAHDLTRRHPRARRTAACAAACAILVLGSVSFRQLGYWRDSRALLLHALDVTSDNWFAHEHLALLSAKRGEWVEAQSHYQEAIRLNPRWSEPRNNFGILLMNQGLFREALEQFSVADTLDPNQAATLCNIGDALSRLGLNTEALGAYGRSLTLDPAYAPAHNNLGILLARTGDRGGALLHFNAALRSDPANASARENIVKLSRPP